MGNVLGGRFADRHPRPGPLAGLLVLAAAILAVSAFLPPVVARAVLPDQLPLESAHEFLQKGAFVTTLICFVVTPRSLAMSSQDKLRPFLSHSNPL